MDVLLDVCMCALWGKGGGLAGWVLCPAEAETSVQVSAAGPVWRLLVWVDGVGQRQRQGVQCETTLHGWVWGAGGPVVWWAPRRFGACRAFDRRSCSSLRAEAACILPYSKLSSNPCPSPTCPPSPAVLYGMHVVQAIEAAGSPDGTPAQAIRIADSGEVYTPA